jgi:hypothetical protein
VCRSEEVASRSDLLVCSERQRLLVDLQRRELGMHHLQQLDVDDVLLEARDQAALEPAGRVHHPVGPGQEGRHQRHQRLVARLGVGDLRGGERAAGPERQPEVARDLAGAEQTDARLRGAEGR